MGSPAPIPGPSQLHVPHLSRPHNHPLGRNPSLPFPTFHPWKSPAPAVPGSSPTVMVSSIFFHTLYWSDPRYLATSRSIPEGTASGSSAVQAILGQGLTMEKRSGWGSQHPVVQQELLNSTWHLPRLFSLNSHKIWDLALPPYPEIPLWVSPILPGAPRGHPASPGLGGDTGIFLEQGPRSIQGGDPIQPPGRAQPFPDSHGYGGTRTYLRLRFLWVWKRKEETPGIRSRSPPEFRQPTDRSGEAGCGHGAGSRWELPSGMCSRLP